MGKYSRWIKKTEETDIENFYAFTGNKKIKAVRNALFCIFMFVMHVASGFTNPLSSHSFLVFFPYVFMFIPFPFLLASSVRLFILPVSITKKQWEKSLGSLKKAGIGLIILSGLCLLCEVVFFFTHTAQLRETGAIRTELVFGIMQLILFSASLLYGFFFDKNFSGK